MKIELGRIAEMKTFVSYVRVSTRQQGMQGLGIESQLNTVRDYISRQDGKTVGEFKEVESGKNVDRPELLAALALCKKTKSTLIVAKLDRLSRNAEFLLSLQNAGVEFICCDAPNVDKFTVGILALVAQRERELISERTRAALQVAKSRGVRLGAVDPIRSVTVMNEGARQARVNFSATVRPVILDIQKAGISTLQGIAEALNRRGIATRTKKSWHASTVRNILHQSA